MAQRRGAAMIAAMLAASPALAGENSIDLQGGSSTAIGCYVVVPGLYEIGYGLAKTMAIQHIDAGTWTIDWPEVDRVAALDYFVEPGCQSSVIVSVARTLKAARGVVKETP